MKRPRWLFFFLCTMSFLQPLATHALEIHPSDPPLSTAHKKEKASPRPSINDVYVIHFLLDGVNASVFERLLKAGKLPAIQQHVLEHGAYFPKAIAPFPATSTTSYQSFVTGLFPGNAGIPHLERFDRNTHKVIGYLQPSGFRKINQDLVNIRALEDPEDGSLQPPTTIFELLHGYPTAAIYSSFYRGASFVHPTSLPLRAFIAAFITKKRAKLDRLAFAQVLKLFHQPPNDIPRYSLVGLLSSDVVGHVFGGASPEVEAVLVQFDTFMSHFYDLLKQQGIQEKVYVIISSDHGMHDTGQHFSLQSALQNEGIAVTSKHPRLHASSLYMSDRGVSSTQLYISSRDRSALAGPLTNAESLRHYPRRKGGSIDLLSLLQRFSEINLIAARDHDDQVLLIDHEGHTAHIQCGHIRHREWCSYTPHNPHDDPLGYLHQPSTAKLSDGMAHATTTWLKAAAMERYPDAVLQLSQIFRNARTGDVFVIAGPSWVFRKVKKASHGSLDKEDMHIPLLLAGPEVPQGTFALARSVDVYPLLLKWFGLHRASSLSDGRDPFSALPHDDERTWQQLARLDAIFGDHPLLSELVDVPGFLRSTVFPVVPAAVFSTLMLPAQQELQQRKRTVEHLQQLQEALEKEQLKDRRKQHRLHDLLRDHLSIVRWQLATSSRQLHHMEDIVSILTTCQHPESIACRGR